MSNIKPSAYKVSPLSRKDIEEYAIFFRKLLGLENTMYVDVINILENIMPILDEKFELYIVPDWELDAHARTYPNDHIIKIRETVYEGARSGSGRDRFTIMHEIFHYLKHDSSDISLARNPENIKPFENPEWQADVFAGAFLMPRYLIENMTKEEIVKKCGVSEAAATFNLKLAKEKR